MESGTHSEEWDLVVVGAGAAGLVAAARAAERGRRTLLLEKNPRPGVKILMSGGTRCNLTQNTDNRGIVRAFGPAGKFLHSALAALGVRETVTLFESLGVPTKVEPTGKIFPQSDRADDVLAALGRWLDASGAKLACGEPVTAIAREAERFLVTTPRRTIRAPSLLLTTGGQSYPGSGTTGDGYAFARSLGHTIVPPRPALVPLTTQVPWVRELMGVTLPDVELRIQDAGRVAVNRRSSLLFAHFGLSGPAALDVSRYVSGHAQPASLVAEIDLFPDRKVEQLDASLRETLVASGRKQLAVILGDWLPRRLADVTLAEARLPQEQRAAELSRDARSRLVHALKALAVPLSGTLGFKRAEVTAGGVSLDEVDSRDMQSKLVPGLYFAGEILDLDGPIGGYNFQAAWSTGYLAGGSVKGE